MRTLVVYESEYGNTEKLARAMAEALSEHGEARVAPIGSATGIGRHGADLLIVGAPTQRHGLPPSVKDALDAVPEGRLDGLRALAFDTRYRRARWISGSAAKQIHHILHERGCRLLAPPESFFVEGSEGPLEPGEEDRARAWALHALGRPQHATHGRREGS